MKISEAIRLKKRGYSTQEIAKKAHVTPQAVNKALIKAKEKGLWNGESGIGVRDEHSYDKYLKDAKNSKMIGNPLSRKEWNDLWKEEPTRQQKREKRTVLPDGSLKPKPLPKYRCFKCRISLTPLDEVRFKQKDEIREQLISQGYTHICLECLTVYERSEQPQSGESEPCPYCNSELAFLRYEGKLTNVLWCEECEKGFLAEKEGLKKIRKYAQKTKQPLSKQAREGIEEVEGYE